jgi:hypothetical protein
MNTLGYYKNSKLTSVKSFYTIGSWDPRGYSRQFSFFVTYEWTQIARVLHYTRLKMLAWDKNSNLFETLLSYEENQMLPLNHVTEPLFFVADAVPK